MRTLTFMQKPAGLKREWKLVDVKGKVLGDVAPEIARMLLGKTKSTYTPHIDCGDYVIVINAKHVVVTGKKENTKMYYMHSGFPGGLRKETFAQVMEKNPARIIEHAVRGMLPKNKLLTPRMRRMKVFSEAEHTYADKFGKAHAKAEK